MKTRIYKLLINPLLLFFSWIVFFLSPLVSIFRKYYIENKEFFNFNIPGLSTLLYYFPFMIVLVVLFIQLIWLGEFMRGRIKKLHKKPFILISIMSLIFVIIIQKMFNLQYLNYPNYIYSKYGITIIQLQFMNFVALLELMLFITIYLFNVGGRTSTNLNIPVSNVKFLGNNNMFNGKITFEKVSVLISTLSIFGLFVLSTSVFLDWTKLSSTSREGYEAKVGKDYKYIELISTKTSKDVKIIHPPQEIHGPQLETNP